MPYNRKLSRSNCCSLEMIRLRAWISFMLITAVLVACNKTGNDKDIDRSFLTDKPCTAPCWYGLELNISSQDEVINTLRQLSFVDQNSIQKVQGRSEDENLEELRFSCIRPEFRKCGRIVFREGKMWRITMSIGYHLTFAETVQKLGPPSAVFLIPSVEVVGCTVSLSWPENKIRVEGDTRLSCSKYYTPNGVKVDPSTQVDFVSYRSDLTKEMVRQEGYEPWRGFLEP